MFAFPAVPRIGRRRLLRFSGYGFLQRRLILSTIRPEVFRGRFLGSRIRGFVLWFFPRSVEALLDQRASPVFPRLSSFTGRSRAPVRSPFLPQTFEDLVVPLSLPPPHSDNARCPGISPGLVHLHRSSSPLREIPLAFVLFRVTQSCVVPQPYRSSISQLLDRSPNPFLLLTA